MQFNYVIVHVALLILIKNKGMYKAFNTVLCKKILNHYYFLNFAFKHDISDYDC